MDNNTLLLLHDKNRGAERCPAPLIKSMCPKGPAGLIVNVSVVFAVICKHCCAGDRRRYGGGSEPGGNVRTVARVG